MKIRWPLLFVAMFLSVMFIALSAQQTCNQNCTGAAPPFRSLAESWPQGTTTNPTVVTVNVSSAFGGNASCIKAAFDNWNAASQQNGLGVTFQVTTNVSPTSMPSTTTAPPANTFYYNVNPVTTNNPAAVPGTTGGGAAGTSPNEYRVTAGTTIDSQATNCTAITETMAHEIGHTFGLGDCTACTTTGESVMNGAKCTTWSGSTCTAVDYNDTTYGRTGPSNCDKKTVCTGIKPCKCKTP